MSIFIDYPNKPFSNLSKDPTVLIEATSNSLWVNSIIVCNRGRQTIRFNLKLLKAQEAPVETFLINELPIPPFKSINVLDFLEKDYAGSLGGVLNLEYSVTPSISDSLVCFSNGDTQIFDCTVNFTRLNELPLI
jgi:hypothetical protein